MAYETPITIKEAITSIQDQEYILPAIQREFVWNTSQIEILFDSILRDYPISTFLFWKVKAENVNKFKFYRFLQYYHQRDKKHNDPAELSASKDRFAILDGQQRLTSLYLGLKGSYAYKLNRYEWKSNHAFPIKHLYLNLLEQAEGSEKLYDLRFLSSEDLRILAEKFPGKYYWFKVSEVLDFKDLMGVIKYLTANSLTDTSKFSEKQVEFATDLLSKLFKAINEDKLINYYLEKSEELDKVLHIFIRVNSGGTKLSYSDLLLSIATAQWKDKDAREIIHGFVDNINKINPGFNVHKDLILKACLVLSDIKDIKFKVDNFSSENMELIEKGWDKISTSLSNTVKLIASFGFSDKTLTAYNAIIPISYFLHKNGIGEEILNSSSQLENRKFIKEWLLRALLKKVFGGTPDNLYPTYRDLITQNPGKFPLHELIQRYKGTNKSLSFDEETIDNLMNTQYGSAFAFMVLSIIYPLNHNYVFHQDHIHPKKFFTDKELIKLGIKDEGVRNSYKNSFNYIANLQLIQETENLEKNATPFFEWLNKNYKEEDLINYKNLHFIPKDNNLLMDDFLTFYEERKDILKSKLMLLLKVEAKTILVEDEAELIEEELS
ncbi:DUF262 domain-containing protein [Flavobacterium sp. GA093]|uniref:DUF262 domain-containing protein n=1 Tax=Flavobacterium hydrocarbonoxydans TaxID=2683249 RepID=A0A6I4NS20_9FLAO|nr:DUF262 domain-containing protein [Flavobacterium hydrocarbonoxydans]MWB96911.1 DUF262 domain-containing protein [Flavobacterium hydrocarbonoxydans]